MIRYIGDNQPENLEKYIPSYTIIGYKCCAISAITAFTYFIYLPTLLPLGTKLGLLHMQCGITTHMQQSI